MALTDSQQFFSLLSPEKEVLIVLPEHPSGDAVCAGLALRHLLANDKIRASLTAPGFTIPQHLSWLPDATELTSVLPSLGTLLLRMELGSAVADLHHTTGENGITTIHLTPFSGLPQQMHPITPSISDRFQAVVIIGAGDHASLGTLSREGRDLLFRVPVIVIDNHPANERFGTLNLVYPAAAAICQIIFELYAERRGAIDRDAATHLLTGLVAATRSFKQEYLPPRALAITAELMTLGAPREEIVKNLYRTRTVETLRLWGRALARLKFDPVGIVWTVLGNADYLHAGVGPDAVPGIIEELIAYAPEAKIALVLYETPEGMCGEIETQREHAAHALSAGLPESVGTHRAARFYLRSTSVSDAEQRALAHIKNSLAAMSGQEVRATHT